MRSSNATALPAPERTPERPTSLPEVVPARPKRPRSPIWWLLGGLCILAGLGAAWRLTSSSGKPKTETVSVRKVKVRRGTLVRELRLAGVTVAQRFSNLLTPQLWGGRER